MLTAILLCRGHVDSVNEVAWQPYSSSLLTASSDKTVSIWDARSGLCTQTFYGHHNSCSCATFNLTVCYKTAILSSTRLPCCRLLCMWTCHGHQVPAKCCACWMLWVQLSACVWC